MERQSRGTKRLASSRKALGNEKIILITFLILLIGTFAAWWLKKEGESVQRYVKERYMDEGQLIHTYPNNPSSQYLSESIGLYMDYLLLKDDETAFSRQVEVLKKHFLEESNTGPYIRWVIKEETGVNALIDGVRVKTLPHFYHRFFTIPLIPAYSYQTDPKNETLLVTKNISASCTHSCYCRAQEGESFNKMRVCDPTSMHLLGPDI